MPLEELESRLRLVVLTPAFKLMAIRPSLVAHVFEGVPANRRVLGGLPAICGSVNWLDVQTWMCPQPLPPPVTDICKRCLQKARSSPPLLERMGVLYSYGEL